ncbi:LON peptidase N-terminal domain and RING finger protein 2 isoform X2 [Spea bombifrons]|uniref:LON peptidase N-terminal domain and RING finger protein 2 isoform X2 n=1 Tax=Spea bombifrons TaxID=233779 RepID=UPI00234BF5DB|nr:LON peptidase N-terminal domain and RING finger protein 2 isoform X2 [Spea bombifrons]
MEVRSMQCSDPLPLDLPGLCSEMLGVAEEAFRAGNFDLAAEIYGSQLDELPQPERSLYLRKGDALALAGRIADALDSYTKAAMLGQLHPGDLEVLVGSIALNIREKELKLPGFKVKGDHDNPNEHYREALCPYNSNTQEVPCGLSLGTDLFSCPMCNLLLLDPVTLNCGHTFCKRCLCEKEPLDCSCCRSRCNNMVQGLTTSCEGLKVNVVLCNLLEKWLGAGTRIRRLSLEGDNLRQEKNFVGALEKFNTALELAPCDSLLIVQRAELHSAMKNFKQALYDADTVCKKHPLWPKGHYVKAQALSGLGRTDDALKEFLYCVALNPEWSSMKIEAQKIMCDMLCPAFENVQASLGTPFCFPASYTRLKSTFLNSTSSSPSVEDVPPAGCSKDSLFRLTKASLLESDVLQSKDFLDLPAKKSQKFLSCLPGAGHKRKHTNSSEELQSLENPAKIIKKDAESACEPSATMPRISEVPVALVDASDFECSLCMRLFYEPVTTPCGHTFCLKCLERCLDHNPHCPLCKENLSPYLANRAYKKTQLTEELITRYLQEEHSDRKRIYDEEMKELSNLNKDVPIFVCTMAFPTIPCPLHVFEPRYRLMIRRSMETGTKQFGMCIADELKGFADYGCMLHVRDVKFFPDGRSVVDTVGLSRFKVLSHGQRDGYHTANIEYLEDKKVEGQEYEELLVLHNSVYDQALLWFTSLKDNLKAQILNHFGPMPSKESELQSNPSGPAWCWWMLAVLPLENKAQLTILAMTSLKDRLLAIRRVLIFVTRPIGIRPKEQQIVGWKSCQEELGPC